MLALERALLRGFLSAAESLEWKQGDVSAAGERGGGEEGAVPALPWGSRARLLWSPKAGTGLGCGGTAAAGGTAAPQASPRGCPWLPHDRSE